MSRRSHPQEIRQLTGLRGLLALDVVVGHLDFLGLPGVGRVVFHNVAVDIFFALSGFVLALTYIDGTASRLDIRRYLNARFARIYPLYLFALLLVLALLFHWHGDSFATATPSRLAGAFVSQLLLLGALPIPATAGFWDVPAWSVSAEAFCYLAVFPPLHLVARLVPVRAARRRLLAFALLACCCDFLFFARFFDPVVLGIQAAPPPCGTALWVALVRATTMFAAGWCVFLASRGRGHDRLLRIGADLLAFAFLIVVLFGGTALVDRQRLVFLAPFLIGCLAADGSVASRLLSLPPIVFLGRISYPLYLLHVPVLLVAFHSAWLTSGPVRMMVGTTLAALAVASVTHATIEVPMRRLIRSWAPRRRSGAGETATDQSTKPSAG